MRPILIFSFLAGLVIRATAFGAPPDRPAEKRTLTVDGRERHYRFYVPSEAKTPAPLVLVLHGGGSNADQMERYTRFDEPAERDGFIVVYPESIDGNWNDGRGASAIRAQRDHIDDVKFLRAVVDDAAREHAIDRSRVFATGISNGAMMSHRLAAEAADLVAGIAPVVGGLPKPLADKFAPRFPVSMLIIQGDADPIVPFAGGEVVVGRGKRGAILSTNEAFALYGKRNGNPGAPSESTLDTDANDETSVTIRRYALGPSGAKTELYVVRDGGHAWPGRPAYLPHTVIGRASQDFSATDIIWEFFKACPPRREATSSQPAQ
jgi:polyhydroxybutyrate depolymerase